MTKIDEFATQVGRDYKALSEIVDSLMSLHSLSMSESQTESTSTSTSQSTSVSETVSVDPWNGTGYENQNPPASLTGLKGYFFGDSLTEVNARTSKGYVAWLKELLGIEAVNKGMSATAFQTRVGSEMFGSKDIYDCDFIYIAMGTNDWWNVSKYNLQLVGPNGMKDMAGLSGLMYENIKNAIYSTKGTRPVFVQTPIRTLISANNATREGGYSLMELRNQIVLICNELNKIFGNVIVVDMTNEDPMGVWADGADNSALIQKYYTQGTIVDRDGVHPNDTGWELLSKIIADKVKAGLTEKYNPDGYCIYEPKYSTENDKEVITFSVLNHPTKEIGNTWYRFYFTKNITDPKDGLYLYNLLSTNKYNVELTFQDGTKTSNVTKTLDEKWHSTYILYTEENRTDNEYYRRLFKDENKVYTYDPESTMKAVPFLKEHKWDSIFVDVKLTEK